MGDERGLGKLKPLQYKESRHFEELCDIPWTASGKPQCVLLAQWAGDHCCC